MKCQTPYCRNPKGRGHFCHKCISRKYRAKNPMRSAYNNLRQNAKRRGKEFQVTFEEFESFCVNSNYIAGKGRKAESFHVDRIDESGGYTLGNLQVLTNSDNVRKYLHYSHDQKGKPINFHVVKNQPVKEDPNVPF